MVNLPQSALEFSKPKARILLPAHLRFGCPDYRGYPRSLLPAPDFIGVQPQTLLSIYPLVHLALGFAEDS